MDRLDHRDQKILSELMSAFPGRKRFSARWISERTGIPRPTVNRRLRSLEKRGLIRYKPILSDEITGLVYRALVFVSFKTGAPNGSIRDRAPVDAILRCAQAYAPDVVCLDSCFTMLGSEHEMVIRLRSRSQKDAMAFVEDHVRKLDFVEDTYTHPIIVDFCEGEIYVSEM